MPQKPVEDNDVNHLTQNLKDMSLVQKLCFGYPMDIDKSGELVITIDAVTAVGFSIKSAKLNPGN